MTNSSHAAPEPSPNPPVGETTQNETSPFDALSPAAPPAEETPVPQPEPVSVPEEPYVEPRGPRWPWLIVLALLLGGGWFVKSKIDAREARRWAPIAMPERMAIVPNAWSAITLAAKLKNNGKIRDEAAFIEAAQEVKLDNVTPGGYLLPATAGPRDLARVFKAGPTHEKATFPEGFTGVQIAARLKREGFRGADEMERLIYPANGFSPYEGTLFPDTYWLPLRANGKTLIAKMQEKFAEEIKQLPQPLPSVQGKPLTTRDVVIIASLIERETNSRAEMPLVAGVMINRLNKPMRLQIDATVQYARILQDKEHKNRLMFEDLKIDSPFNTYRNDGLPPTPICNPGKAALLAAARPAKTDALFYVYSPKLKKHIFSPNFEAHKHNVALARHERAEIEAQAN